MPYLDTYQPVLSGNTAAHLLRRATFGPTKPEIVQLTGMTATQAVDLLIANASYTANPASPVDLDDTRSTFGQTFTDKPLNRARFNNYSLYLKYWWLDLMLKQNNHPSILEKLTAFWQNHFVVTQSAVLDYRLTYDYITQLRHLCLGSFKDMTIEMTKNGGMLIFQNGNENQKGKPNENYARELQELFTVGVKNYAGDANYTEEDVKAASRALTGWQVKNSWVDGSTDFEVLYNPDRHDTTDKTFSQFYGNTTISGRSGPTSGDAELNDLVSMLLQHPECPKFICRKLYRWYVNADVTQDIETNVITPLADFFAGSANNFQILPVLRKLLTSQIFYDQQNTGSMIKSPVEWVVGLLRFFEQPVPDSTTDRIAFRKYAQLAQDNLFSLQYILLDQPTVFGYAPYYQTGYSDNWINGTTLGRRSVLIDRLMYPSVEIKPGYIIGIDVLQWAINLQPNFSDVANTPSITSEQVLAAFSENLFAVELLQSQKNFLIDSIMMRGLPRQNWITEWNGYRANPTSADRKNGVQYRLRLLLRHMLRMAEFHIF